MFSFGIPSPLSKKLINTLFSSTPTSINILPTTFALLIAFLEFVYRLYKMEFYSELCIGIVVTSKSKASTLKLILFFSKSFFIVFLNLSKTANKSTGVFFLFVF